MLPSGSSNHPTTLPAMDFMPSHIAPNRALPASQNFLPKPVTFSTRALMAPLHRYWMPATTHAMGPRRMMPIRSACSCSQAIAPANPSLIHFHAAANA